MKGFVKNSVERLRVLIISAFMILRTLMKGKRERFQREENKEVIILGNGPSLNDIDLDVLKKSDLEIACVNFFPIKNTKFFELKPKYLALFDPIFYQKPDELIPSVKQLFDLLENIDWDLTIICAQTQSLIVKNQQIRYAQINTSSLYSKHLTKYLDWLYQKNLLSVGLQNVVIGAGFFFIGKGVKRIYYSGVDMSEFKQLFVDEENRIYVDAIHNYGTERHYSKVVKKGEFYLLLSYYQKMFEQLHYLAQYANRQNVDIINLSVGSYIDVFEKKSFDSIDF